jgi:hypothetical protein
MAIQDILNNLATGQYGHGAPRYSPNAFAAAPKLAQGIIGFQEQQRAAPLESALSSLSSQWKSASPAQRANLHTQADAIRAAYLQGGGDPSVIPTNLWGANPQQGFQVDGGQYAPGYSPMSGLTMGQQAQLSAAQLKAALDQLNERAKIASLSGIDPVTGQPSLTMQRLNQSIAYENARLADAQARLGTAKGRSGLSQGKMNIDSQIRRLESMSPNVYKSLHGTQAPVQVIEQQINSQRDYLISQGIDPDTLINYAYEQIYHMSPAAYWKAADSGTYPPSSVRVGSSYTPGGSGSSNP